MKRRTFLEVSAALTCAVATNTGVKLSAQDALPFARAITRGPKFHWRGYYDKLLFDPANRFVLANEVDFEGRSPRPDDILRVGMIDLEQQDRWIELGVSHAWNWQQGCMLQWLPGSSAEVLWNDRHKDQFVCHILNVQTGQQRILPLPIYCVSPDGRWGFTTDFRRLNDTRPGYGYGGLADPNFDKQSPDDVGIWRVDLLTGESVLIFSLAAAAALPFSGRPDASPKQTSKHWFNHLLCNTDGSRLFFLHRWHAPGDKSAFYTRALTIAPDGSGVFVLDPWGGTSHFVWRDPEHVLAWAWHPSHQDRFYLFRDKTDQVTVVGKDTMTRNGHNTYVPGTDQQWVLNDTYPDAEMRQHPYLYHIPSDRIVPLGGFVSPQQYRGEWRCDTHPCASRDGRIVVFDSPHDGGRQVYRIDVADLLV
jgi:hypothetical protein